MYLLNPQSEKALQPTKHVYLKSPELKKYKKILKCDNKGKTNSH
jgi:hypothetical protein